MRIALKRCSHCQAVYECLLSGWDPDAHKDGRYCPDCKDVVNKALEALPVRYECRYFKVEDVPAYSDVTRAHIEEWEAALVERRKTELVAQRIWPSLYNLETGDSQSIRLVVATSGPHTGTGFRVSSWKQNPEYVIEIGMEWDTKTHEPIGVWKSYT